MKVIRISEDGYVWEIPLLAIAQHRADNYAKDEPPYDETFRKEVDYVLDDDYEGIDWFQNNMDWEHVKEHARLVKEPTTRTEPEYNDRTRVELVNLEGRK